VSTWFYTVIIEPVTTFFAGLWEGISSGASACWNATVEFFTPAVEWFSELFGNIFQTISDIFYNIGVIASGCWELLKIAWDEAIGFFSTLWEGISTFASDCWDGIVNVWTSATGWVDTNIIQPIATLFSGLWEDISGWATDCWDGIKTVFSTVGEFFGDTFSAAWQGIVDVFSVAGDIFVDIKDGVVSAFVTIVNAIISGINKVVKIPFDAINGFLKWLKDIDVAGYHPFKGVKLITVPQIPTIELKTYAEGGFVDKGQAFIASEQGPELVGTIGRKTAVVNNEQIIEGIASGVSVANSESNALLREQNALLRGILEKESGVYLDGKHLSDSVDKYKRERGRVLVTGGAY
jgi:phage-related protein